MKRLILILLLLTVPSVGMVATVKYWPRLFPSGKTSVLYARYEHTEGIEADFVKQMKFDGGERIDVTLLHATDSASWARLKRDLHIVEQPVEALRRLGIEPADIHLQYVDRTNPDLQMRVSDFSVHDCVATCYSRQTVCVFHLDSQEQMETMFAEVAEHRMNNIIN